MMQAINSIPALRSQRGAALVVGLVLLLVITMLAVTSMNTSTVQLMCGQTALMA